MATAVAVVVGGDFDRREGEVEWAVRAASGRVSRERGGWTRNKLVESETAGFIPRRGGQHIISLADVMQTNH